MSSPLYDSYYIVSSSYYPIPYSRSWREIVTIPFSIRSQEHDDYFGSRYVALKMSGMRRNLFKRTIRIFIFLSRKCRKKKYTDTFLPKIVSLLTLLSKERSSAWNRDFSFFFLRKLAKLNPSSSDNDPFFLSFFLSKLSVTRLKQRSSNNRVG